MKKLKNKLLTLILAIACGSPIMAQKKVDLETYAPKNPKPYMYMAPLPHSYAGKVVRVDNIWQNGKVLSSYHYNNNNGVLDSVSNNRRKSKYVIDNYRAIKNDKGLVIEEYREQSDADDSKSTYMYYSNNSLKTYTRWKRKQIKKGVYKMVEDKTVNYEYDNIGRVVKEGGYVFKYSIKGKQLVINTFKDDKQSFQYIYDRYGTLVSTTSFWGETPKTTNYTNVRDKNDNVIYTISDQDDKIQSIKKFYYKDGSVSESPHEDLSKGLVIKDNDLYWNGFNTDVSNSQGFYEKGRLQGLGWIVDYGTRWEGNFKDGELNGYGMIQDLSKFETFISGTFKDGKLNGRGMKFENGRPVEVGIYKKGKLIEANDVSRALSDDTTCKEKETCPDGFQRKKEQGVDTYSYSFIENAKPIGPSFMTNGRVNAHVYSDASGLVFFNGEINNVRVLANYKNNKMQGLGYFSQGKNFKAGIFENNELKKSLIK